MTASGRSRPAKIPRRFVLRAAVTAALQPARVSAPTQYFSQSNCSGAIPLLPVNIHSPSKPPGRQVSAMQGTQGSPGWQGSVSLPSRTPSLFMIAQIHFRMQHEVQGHGRPGLALESRLNQRRLSRTGAQQECSDYQPIEKANLHCC